MPPYSVSKNNMSALRETVFVQEAISDLLDRGLIQKCDYVPKVVNPLTVSVQSNGKKRLIFRFEGSEQVHLETKDKV